MLWQLLNKYATTELTIQFVVVIRAFINLSRRHVLVHQVLSYARIILLDVFMGIDTNYECKL